MHWFTKLYLAAGAGLLGLFALADMSGGMLPTFGRPNIDTSSRQGYWYASRKSPPPSSYGSPGRSPGGGGYGGGGYSGGK
jgi:hypothetical protein